jgi:hypothetical protein
MPGSAKSKRLYGKSICALNKVGKLSAGGALLIRKKCITFARFAQEACPATARMRWHVRINYAHVRNIYAIYAALNIQGA